MSPSGGLNSRGSTAPRRQHKQPDLDKAINLKALSIPDEMRLRKYLNKNSSRFCDELVYLINQQNLQEFQQAREDNAHIQEDGSLALYLRP